MVSGSAATAVAIRSARVALRIAHAAIFVVIVLTLGATLFVSVFTTNDVLRVRNEITGSMSPMIEIGDLVLYRPTRSSALRPGDVIGFHRPGQQLLVTHRVVSVDVASEAVTVRTKGDANASVDQTDALFSPDETVWRVWNLVPGLGRPVSQLSGGRGLPFALGLIPLFFALPWIERQLPGRPRAASPAGGPDRRCKPSGAARAGRRVS